MLILKNTTEVLLFSHELKTNEEMAGATRSNLSRGQRLASEGVFKWKTINFANARHRRTWQKDGSGHKTSTWVEIRSNHV